MNQWDYPGDSEKAVTSRDLYEILGIARDATDSQIKRAYHKLAMVHHPDKRTSNPEGSDEAFKEIGYAYQVLSDADKRAIYDRGGTAALEEQEGIANINLDHLMMSVLMWETGQKACFLCVLCLVLLEGVIPPLLISLRMDGTLEWSWFGVTAPLWLPLGLFALLLVCAAPLALRRQFQAAAEPGADPQLAAAASASAMACAASTVVLGCIICSGAMYCGHLDNPDAGYTFQQAAIGYYILEGLTLITYVGQPLKSAAEGLLGKAGRVATVALLSSKLDGAEVPWVAVLSPVVLVTLAGLAGTLYDVRSHRRLKARAKAKDFTMEEEASRYEPFFFALRGVMLVGFSLALGLLALRLCFGIQVSFAQAVMPLVVSLVIVYVMVCWGLLCFRPAGLPGGEYDQFPSGSESYGTFQGGNEDYV